MTDEAVEVRLKGRSKRLKRLELALTDTDIELASWGAEFLGVNRSEFIRTAIRSHVTALQGIARTMRG